ncbi:MAG: c-type cytochrome [Acidimicrobiia bacterium]|nr:c-type cytochrome [Acidimicrobiia bacterium]
MSDHSADHELGPSTERWMKAGLVLMAAFVLAFPFYRLYEPERRTVAREELQVSLAAVGANLFSDNCSSCHGINGRGGLAPALATHQFLDSANNRQIEQLISIGIPGSEMVAYGFDNGGPLTSEQVHALATYLRSLEDVAADNPNWRQPLAAGDLSGREIFLLGCSRCHGANLEGTDDAPDLGPGSDAAEDSDARLIRQIRDGGDEMPRFGTVLTEEQMQLIVDYLREEQSRE